jgi:hypothetical protein
MSIPLRVRTIIKHVWILTDDAAALVIHLQAKKHKAATSSAKITNLFIHSFVGEN